ncbi:hypothetical protein GGP41_009020 [Bipolaris sorokiniana]|uniref:Uncharacterized protein n=1 Tax=Cochliobolus sativus TaxID=45130 RepID=A0A8H5ZEH8_COCSA|nr:hypothetical protein GGP41_009020 [Bipolaris sorokiniana]
MSSIEVSAILDGLRDRYLPRKPQTRVGKEDELKEIEKILTAIATYPTGFALQNLTDSLWDTLLVFSYDEMNTVIHRLQRSFKVHQSILADLVTQMFGFGIDNDDCKLDHTLGKQIIQLFHDVQAYTELMKDTNKLIMLTYSMMTETEFQERLSDLIGNASFANELFVFICKLGFPREAYSTLVSVASTPHAFENVTLRNGSLSSAGHNQQQSHKLNEVINVQQHSDRTSSSPLLVRPILQGPQPVTDAVPQVCKPVPRTKQEVALLIETASRGNLLPKYKSAWYSFGFVCTTNEEDERRLAGLYAVLIGETYTPESFHELQNALETCNLAILFDTKGYGNFRELSTHLETFLVAPREQRPTVWRLKQFIHDADSTDPPACLQRDYGFKYCKQRDEVMCLKFIYSKMLEKMEVMELHSACVHGRLYETAIRMGVSIRTKDERLMKNDYPSPFVGFDNTSGLENYRKPLFKKQQKT